ncbi:MAG: hypothetical protein NZZ41_00070 [Candidatus Dojkabacteria bacterium]|nr:hypothetical protein [Candidatus Dojkabacteria bacterium]
MKSKKVVLDELALYFFHPDDTFQDLSNAFFYDKVVWKSDYNLENYPKNDPVSKHLDFFPDSILEDTTTGNYYILGYDELFKIKKFLNSIDFDSLKDKF